MTNPEQEPLTPQQEMQLERLVDTRGFSYDDAYRELGLGKPSYDTDRVATDNSTEIEANREALNQAQAVAGEIAVRAVMDKNDDPQAAAIARAKEEKRQKEKDIIRRQKGL